MATSATLLSIWLMALLQTGLREPTPLQVAQDASLEGLAIASRGESSVAAYSVYWPSSQRGVHVLHSDGRGLAWSAPTRIDESPVPVRAWFSKDQAIGILDDEVFVVWADDRSGWQDLSLYLNVSRDGGQTWEGEQALDALMPAGHDWVGGDARVVATTDEQTGRTLVHVVFSVASRVSSYVGSLYLTSSEDGGRSWSTPRKVPSDLEDDSFQLSDGDVGLAAEGRELLVGWCARDFMTPYSVRVRTSDDGGRSWSGPSIQLSDPHAIFDVWGYPIHLRMEDGVAAVVWSQIYPTSSGYRGAYYSVRWPGAGSFEPSRRAGGFAPTGFRVEPLAPLIVDGEVVFPLDLDDGRTDFRLVCWRELGPGQSPVESEFRFDERPGKIERVHGSGDSMVAVADRFLPNGSHRRTLHRSFDGGRTWAGEVAWRAGLRGLSTWRSGWSERYENLLLLWSDDGSAAVQRGTYVGGLRVPRVLAPATWQRGRELDVEVRGFGASSNGEQVQLLLSSSPGHAPTSDGRITGLAMDHILRATSGPLRDQLTATLLDGAATFSGLVVPDRVPHGTALWYCAVSSKVGATGGRQAIQITDAQMALVP